MSLFDKKQHQKKPEPKAEPVPVATFEAKAPEPEPKAVEKPPEKPLDPCIFMHTWHQDPRDQAQHVCRHCGLERWPVGGGERAHPLASK